MQSLVKRLEQGPVPILFLSYLARGRTLEVNYSRLCVTLVDPKK